MAIGSEQAVNGLRLVHVSRNIQRTELREATTGRPVRVSRIWAVAETAPGSAKQPVAVTQPQPPTPQPIADSAASPAAVPDHRGCLAFYRKYTEAMLRRYLSISTQVGRVPSIMGRELFRGNVSHCKTEGFEDGVIFSIDVERCLAKLRKEDQRLIQRIAIQGYTQEDAAPMLGISLRTCVTKYGEALDRLTEIFLASRMLEPQKCCQAPEAVENSTTA